MTDDQRERQPRRDQGDNPAEDGTRSDHAGSSGEGGSSVAPGGQAVRRAETRSEPDDDATRDLDPLGDVEHPAPDV
jgi:hypothetical protein